MNIACLQNHPAEGPAEIGRWAHDRGWPLTVYPGFEETFPEISEHDALVVMGGPASVKGAEENECIAGAMETIRSFLAAGKGVFGVCLGAQMMAVAAGGRVVEGPEKEIGWYPITRTDAEEGHCLSDLPQERVVFHWHGDHIELPPGATLLASSLACPVQAFQLAPNQLGLQCHLEIDSAAMERMIAEFADELVPGEPGVEIPETMELGLQKWGDSCQRSLHAILDAWYHANCE